jgi:4-amino-4-deoxy-L-arabinose transferase-like glycosyltransferase
MMAGDPGTQQGLCGGCKQTDTRTFRIHAVCGAAVSCVSFVFVCFYGFVRKRQSLIAFALVLFSLLLFNAFLIETLPMTHAPVIPLMVMSMAFAVQLLAQRLKSRFTMRGANSDG